MNSNGLMLNKYYVSINFHNKKINRYKKFKFFGTL